MLLKQVANFAGRLRLYERWLSMRRDGAAIFAEGPWRLSGQAWLASLIRTARGAADDDYAMVASAIAFSSFLALLPLLGAIVLVYGMITPSERVADNVRTLLFILPTEARAFIGDWLIEAITRREGRELGMLTAVGVSLVAAQRAGRSIISGLNVASGVHRRRSFLRRRMVALAIVVSAATLILGALFAISVLAWTERVLPPGLAAILPALRAGFWSLAAAGCGGTLTLVYRYAPHRPPPRWRWMLPGAAAATMLWLAATVAFGAYLGSFGTTHRTYGSVGAIVVLQLWLFLSGFVLLLGAKLNSELMRSANVERGAEG
jgi:membrane protein